ncbi:RNA polymerase sigma factor [Mucilaginibacter psychrotolerans]|uniref:Sigma-70 family RNA polymerase sigma factor n=1 Tax=Mucilaginibacter psychrotolerans TaxID=1524096 RepID=A0A4Y8S956_9SPHI|nr:sigma-70 family RNA polymerase sigma factor [Mucilaginibacter psychrotolerans]TFF34974.1 sigma-70 family RNA polymerase sigma factor [Mucilaginibacter psychrotolerans]
MKSQADKDQFLLLIQQNKKLIFKVCNTYCKDEEDSKDLVQEVIIQPWHAYPNYNDRYKLFTWMYRIALNTAISFYRSHHKRKSATISINEAIFEIADDDSTRQLDEIEEFEQEE